MHINRTKLIHGALFLASAFLTACGGGGGGAATAAATYSIGGTISGLSGTVVLQNNGGDNLTLSTGAATFTFGTKIASGAAYNVTVLTQPAGQTCTASSNSGTVGSTNITGVSVICSANAYTIGGAINGLSGTVVLQNNGTNSLSRSADGSFTFSAPVASGAAYNVTVLTQPAGQRCTVTGGSGTNVQANITSVAVSCINVYAISATVTGYAPSIGLVLQNTGNNNLSISGNGTFPFSKGLANGETYTVKVLIQPAAPARTCTVTGGANGFGSGTMGTSAVNVAVDCIPPVPQFAYVANYSSDDISAYSITGGVLAPIPCAGSCSGGGNFPAGLRPRSITVVPSGKFAYVANFAVILGDGDISAYAIAASGALTQVPCGGGAGCNGANFLAGSNPIAVTVDPTGQFAYAANPNSSDISAYTIDAASGALTKITCVSGCSTNGNFLTGANPASVTIDHTGQFAYVVNANDSNVSAYTINATTGALTPIPCGGGASCDGGNGFPDQFLAGDGPTSLDIDPTSRFAYVANKGEDSVSVYAISPLTGALTQISCGGVVGVCNNVLPATGTNFLTGDEPSSIACDPTGNYVYVANRSSLLPPGSISAYSINQLTGALTQVAGSPFAAGVQPDSLTVDLSGQYVYVANNGTTGVSDVSAYQITAGTGALTQISCGGGLACNNVLPATGTNFLAGSNPASVITTVVY